MPFFSAYIGSKKALNTFYRDLSIQTYKDGISVVITCPGPVYSALGDKSFQVGKDKIEFKDQKMMETSRCAELTLICIANKLNESWVSIQPWLLCVYVFDIFSYQIHYIFKLFNLVRFTEARFTNIRQK